MPAGRDVSNEVMASWIFSIVWMCTRFWLWFATFSSSERVALVAAFFVLVGVVGEYVIELKAIEKKARLKKVIKGISMALLVVGLSGDVLGIIMGQAEMAALIGETGDAATSARNAATDAAHAKADAGEAKGKAQDASTAAGDAESKSKAANAVASNALTQAKAVDKYADLIAFKISWRILDGKRFHELMAGKPTGTAEIWFEPDDEAFAFAGGIAKDLKDAGWIVSGPDPMPADRKWTPKPPMTVLDEMRLDATMNGLAIGSKHLPDLQGKTAVGAFVWALERSMGRLGFVVMMGEYPSLPDNCVIVAVGRHVPFIPPNPYAPETAEPQSSKKNAKR